MNLIINNTKDFISIYNKFDNKLSNLLIVFHNPNQYPVKIFFINNEYLLDINEILKIPLPSINAHCYIHYFYLLEFFKINYCILQNNITISNKLILHQTHGLISQKLNNNKLIIHNCYLLFINNLIIEFLSAGDAQLQFSEYNINLISNKIYKLILTDYNKKDKIIFNYIWFGKNT